MRIMDEIDMKDPCAVMDYPSPLRKPLPRLAVAFAVCVGLGIKNGTSEPTLCDSCGPLGSVGHWGQGAKIKNFHQTSTFPPRFAEPFFRSRVRNR